MLNLRDKLPPSHPLRRFYRRLQAWQEVARASQRVGLPGAATYFPLGGLGDDLLTTALIEPLAEQTGRPIWVLSNHPELFDGMVKVAAVLPPTPETADRLGALGVRVVRTLYTQNLDGGSRHASPPEHILATIARKAKLTGEFTMHPRMILRDEEKNAASFARNAIVMQSSGMGARFPIPNKEWDPNRFAEVAATLAPRHTVIQIGSPSDPAIPAARDLRGQTTVRQMAAILSHARLFVGLVGFPMHVARAVDCPAVIVYGGREAPWQSGYSANLNLYNPVACAPCWLVDRCDHNHQCMRDISVAEVTTAIATKLEQPRAPLVADIARLDP